MHIQGQTKSQKHHYCYGTVNTQAAKWPKEYCELWIVKFKLETPSSLLSHNITMQTSKHAKKTEGLFLCCE